MGETLTAWIGAVGTVTSVASLALTFIVWRWSRRISTDQDALARALAHVQVQEKNGVMRSNADWLSAGGPDALEYRLQSIVQDALSVLRMLKYTPSDLLDDYFESLRRVIDNLEGADGRTFLDRDGHKHCMDTRPFLRQLEQDLVRWSRAPEQDDVMQLPPADSAREAMWTRIGSIRDRLDRLDKKRHDRSEG